MIIEPIHFLLIVVISGISIITGLFYFISPMSFWNMLRIEYYLFYLCDNGTVIKRIIQKKKGQWYIVYQKKAYLIPLQNMIRYKSGSVFYSEVHNAMPLKIMTDAENKEFEELKKIVVPIRKKSIAQDVLSKFPVVNRFVKMKIDSIEEIVFCNKFILNPPFIFDACLLYIMLTQEITKKILEKPVTFMDKIAEHLPLIIFGIIILVGAAMWIQNYGK